METGTEGPEKGGEKERGTDFETKRKLHDIYSKHSAIPLMRLRVRSVSAVTRDPYSQNGTGYLYTYEYDSYDILVCPCGEFYSTHTAGNMVSCLQNAYQVYRIVAGYRGVKDALKDFFSSDLVRLWKEDAKRKTGPEMLHLVAPQDIPPDILTITVDHRGERIEVSRRMLTPKIVI